MRVAQKEDAPMIARVVAMAIGDEAGLRGYCGEEYLAVLMEIASAEQTQYSYQNTLIAEYEGVVAGAVVGYDGAKLNELRSGTLSIIEEFTGCIPSITCTSRGNTGFPASTRERPRETFFNASRGQIPLPWLGSRDAPPSPLAWRPDFPGAPRDAH